MALGPRGRAHSHGLPVRWLVCCSAGCKDWQDVITRGVEQGRFQTPSPQLASYAMLEMGIGIALWYHEDGRLSESRLAYYYGDIALRLVAVQP